MNESGELKKDQKKHGEKERKRTQNQNVTHHSVAMHTYTPINRGAKENAHFTFGFSFDGHMKVNEICFLFISISPA